MSTRFLPWNHKEFMVDLADFCVAVERFGIFDAYAMFQNFEVIVVRDDHRYRWIKVLKNEQEIISMRFEELVKTLMMSPKSKRA